MNGLSWLSCHRGKSKYFYPILVSSFPYPCTVLVATFACAGANTDTAACLQPAEDGTIVFAVSATLPPAHRPATFIFGPGRYQVIFWVFSRAANDPSVFTITLVGAFSVNVKFDGSFAALVFILAAACLCSGPGEGLFDWKAKYSDCRKKRDLGLGCGEEEKPDRMRGGKLGIVHSNHHITSTSSRDGHTR